MKKGLLLLPLLALGLSGCDTIQTQNATWVDVDKNQYQYLEVFIEDFRQSYATKDYTKLSYIYLIKTQGISELKVHSVPVESLHSTERTITFTGHVSYVLI